MEYCRTKSHCDGGLQPKWGDQLEFDIKYIGDDMAVQVLDQNVITTDGLICETKIKVSALCVNGGLDDWWSLMHNGEKVGSLHMIGEWHPRADKLKDQLDNQIDDLKKTNLEHQQKAAVQQQQQQMQQQAAMYQQQQMMAAQQQQYAMGASNYQAGYQ